MRCFGVAIGNIEPASGAIRIGMARFARFTEVGLRGRSSLGFVIFKALLVVPTRLQQCPPSHSRACRRGADQGRQGAIARPRHHHLSNLSALTLPASSNCRR